MAQRKLTRDEKRGGVAFLIGCAAAGAYAWFAPGAHWIAYLILGALVAAGAYGGALKHDGEKHLADGDQH